MKTSFYIKQLFKKAAVVLAVLLFTGCAGTTKTSTPNIPDNQRFTINEAIQFAARSIEETLPRGTLLAVLNFVSPSEAFSDYVIEELTGELVVGNKVTVVDRRSLSLITQEMNLQMSGDVSDESAQAIGKLLGAQSIVSGSLTNLGAFYRFRIRVISVETARIETQVSLDLQNDSQVAYLLGGTSMPVAGAPTPTSQPAPTAQPTTPAPTAQPTTPAPATQPTEQNRPGLYVNGTLQGAMDLEDALDYIKIDARGSGDFVIVLGKNETVASIPFTNMQARITLKGDGVEERTVSYVSARPGNPLFTVGQGATFTLEGGVALTGLPSDGRPLVRVEGGTFIMNGGSIRNNHHTIPNYPSGGGVYLQSGAFTMNGGTISGNFADQGGGVGVLGGTFTMNGGAITGNTATRYGGGVYVEGGVFTMTGGTISGNTCRLFYGGGVCVMVGTFTKSGSGGVIYGSNAPDDQANKAGMNGGMTAAVYIHSGSNARRRDTTARASQALDSLVSGAAGGWE